MYIFVDYILFILRMKKLLFVLTVFATLICVVACNDELVDSKNDPVIALYDMPAPCRIGKVMDRSGMLSPMRPAEIIESMKATALTKANQQYVIPVVFHIFGQEQGNYGIIDAARIHKTLEWINNDFNGIENSGDPITFYDVNDSRKEFMDNINFKFMLARFDESGNKLVKDAYINGGLVLDDYAIILYSANHPVAQVGPGNPWADGDISNIAWDNKKYMNVYITKDLYSNGVLNNSGVAWYPEDGMTAANTARVVYNGKYLPGGSLADQDFTSVITHEFGHFMNLAHTFNENNNFDWIECTSADDDGGSYGDQVADTPEHMCSSYEDENGDKPHWGFDKKNCHGEIIDFGNYMNYGVYCNFTKGQVERMKAALELDARKTLWQEANIKATIGDLSLEEPKDKATFEEKLKDINERLGK